MVEWKCLNYVQKIQSASFFSSYSTNKYINWSIFQYAFHSVRWWKRRKKPRLLCILQLHNYHSINRSMLKEYMNTWRESVDRKQWSNDTRMQIVCLIRWWLNLFANTTQYVWLRNVMENGTCCLIPLCILCRSTAMTFNSFHSPINTLQSNGMISILHPSLSRPALQIW